MEDFFSVENMPGRNSLAVFLPKTRQTFREDAEVREMVTHNGKKYIPWGADDMMPYDIIDLIESDETLSTCQVWNAEMCYGRGLEYNQESADETVKHEIREFFEDNPISESYLGFCQDMKYFAFAVAVIFLSRDGKKIVSMQRKEACYCRFTPADKSGKIKSIVYGNFRNKSMSGEFEEIPLLDMNSPMRDLETRLGIRAGSDGKKSVGRERKFAVVSKFPGVDSLYYPIPYYASLFRGNWYNIKRLIGIAKEAKLKNAAPIKYIIEIAPQYWEEMFKESRIIDPKERKKKVAERKKKIMEFLTSTENTGSILFTGKGVSIDGKESPYISVTSIDSKVKEGGDWESDIAEAINMICFTMHVHSNLVGSVPGKAQNNNSGSDKRELYTIAQALQKPYHDILFKVHKVIIKFNGWKGVYPECPFIQLTTLDEHKDAQQVKL